MAKQFEGQPQNVQITHGGSDVSAANPVPVVVEGSITAVVDESAVTTVMTGGTAKSIVRGGTKGATVPADVTSTPNGSDHQGLDVVEQFAPAYEDNVNGAALTIRKPVATPTYAPSRDVDFGTVTAKFSKASPGNVLGVVGTNANVAGRWFQLHNKATIPLSTEIPIYSFWVAPSGNIVIGDNFFCGSGGPFSTGIGWAWSTTAGTYTAATAADHTTALHFK